MKKGMSIRFRDNSVAALAQITDAISGNIEDMCLTMVELAKRPPPQGSPYDTGNNRDSIDYHKQGQLSFKVQTNTGYGAYLELGTKRMAARPYMAPAYKGAEAEMLAKPRSSWE